MAAAYRGAARPAGAARWARLAALLFLTVALFALGAGLGRRRGRREAGGELGGGPGPGADPRAPQAGAEELELVRAGPRRTGRDAWGPGRPD